MGKKIGQAFPIAVLAVLLTNWFPVIRDFTGRGA